MINWLVGLSSFWEKLNGTKTYLAGTIGLLSGSAGLLGEILKLISDRSLPETFAWIKGLPSDQYVLTFAAGLAAVGLRHAVERNGLGSDNILK